MNQPFWGSPMTMENPICIQLWHTPHVSPTARKRQAGSLARTCPPRSTSPGCSAPSTWSWCRWPHRQGAGLVVLETNFRCPKIQGLIIIIPMKWLKKIYKTFSDTPISLPILVVYQFCWGALIKLRLHFALFHPIVLGQHVYHMWHHYYQWNSLLCYSPGQSFEKKQSCGRNAPLSNQLNIDVTKFIINQSLYFTVPHGRCGHGSFVHLVSVYKYPKPGNQGYLITVQTN